MARARPRVGETSSAAVRRWSVAWVDTAVVLTVVAISNGGAARIAAQQVQLSPVAKPLVIDGATIVDVEQGRLLPAQRIVIVGTRIQAVGDVDAVQLPVGAQVVDARGKYLIPGLWDMHTHVGQLLTESNGYGDVRVVDSLTRVSYAQFIAHGVTGIRDMAQRFPNGADSFRVWQRAISAGTMVGPRGVGPSADVVSNQSDPLHNPGPRVIPIDAPNDADRIVDSLKAAGMAFIKFHDDFAVPELYFAIVRAARRAQIPLVGHTPLDVPDADVADSGQRSIEHVMELRCWFGSAMAALSEQTQSNVGEEDPETCAIKAAAAFIRNGTWIVPTLVNLAEDTIHPQAAWVHQIGRQIIQTLRRLGVARFLAGTDVIGGPSGVTLLKELNLLADAGMTAPEVLRAATLGPAHFFEATDSLGTIAPGKLADLVLLDGDPLADIRNVGTTRAVIANGRYFDRAALDMLDPDGPGAQAGP